MFMRKKNNFKLTESEILQVAEAILQDPRPEVRQRAIAIQMLATGEMPASVARRMSVHPVTIRQWYQRFRQEGYEGLTTQPRGRPKRKADRAYCRALEEAVERHPGEYGYQFTSWTVERLRDHLEKMTGTHLSCSRLRMVMRNNHCKIQLLKRHQKDPRIDVREGK